MNPQIKKRDGRIYTRGIEWTQFTSNIGRGSMQWNPDYELRDYQQSACRQTAEGFLKGRPEDGIPPFQRQLGIAATGSGKTIMASAMVYWNARRGQRSLMLAHTDELVSQAADKMNKSCGAWPATEKAEDRASLDAPVVVGSFQSFASGDRIKRFPVDHFGLVIADEAHLSLAGTFKKTLEYFGQSPQTKILGITATPERSDKRSLMKFYENVAFEVSMADLMDRGHLSPITVQTVPIEIDARGVDMNNKGENQELEEAIKPYYSAIIDAWQAHAADRPTVVFHPTRWSSQTFSSMMVERGILSEHVAGDTPDRKTVLKRFDAGGSQVINNAQLLVAGWDCSRVSCVINLRPTKHRTPFTQMVGRGTRLHPGKRDCLLLDFLWQFEDAGIMRPVNLLTDAEDVAEIAQKRAETGEKQDLMGLNVEAQRERDEMIIRRMRDNAARRAQKMDAREFAATMHQPDLVDYEPVARWESAGVSPKQAALLDKWKIDVDSISGKGHASKIIGAMLDRMSGGLSTPAQVAFMNRLQIDFSVTKTTIDEAKRLIDSRLQKV